MRQAMFFKEQKLDRRISELEPYRYREVQHLQTFAVQEDTANVVNPQVPTDFTGWDTMQVGDDWKGRDRYLWLHREIALPKEWADKRIVGIFDFGKTGGGNNSGFESMCYYRERPYQGVDGNHKEVFFRNEDAGSTVSVTFRLWSGLEGGGVPTAQEHRIRRADLAWLDEAVDDFYYMGSLILDTLKNLEESDPVKYELRKALEEACRCIDWSYPGSPEFYESVHQADALLNEHIDAMDKRSLVTVRCVGHTHIDLAWMWRTKHTREKASRSFSTVLRLMELFPEYIFLQTQPQLYAWLKKDFPDIYAEIKKRAAEGRWEVDGGMWVEADCNLTSGESLTRQILLGSRLIQEEFGREVEYLWLPDVFGYSWALPQILKKSGIPLFMTTKISWNQYNRMPHDTFYWKGMDGSEVLTHFITTPEPGEAPESWYYTYNGQLTPETVKGVWKKYKDKELNQELLISYGFGDGGGGVNRDMLESRRRIDRIPGLPHLKTSTAGEYFRHLRETVARTDQYVHTWDGELYLEYHRGTYTSQGYNKRMNRKAELLYRRAEMLGVLLGLYRADLNEAHHEELREGWQRILLNQFHDIIPGSSIHDVYRDCREEYPKILSIAEQVEQSFEEQVSTKQEHAYAVFNASGWTLNELAEIPCAEDGIFTDADGRVLDAQREGSVTLVAVKGVPATGSAGLYFTPGKTAEAACAFAVHDKEIETPFYQITLNDCGQIARLYDKTFSREVLPEGARANVLQMFEDKPINYDAWDIDLFYQEKMREITDLTECKVVECGALRMKLALAWKYGNSVIRQNLILYRDDRRIDFETYVDYHERHQLMKAAFPVDIRSTYATYDIQYGNVRRPNHWNTSWDQAKFESVAHRFADLSEREYGVALMNDCKYGYDVKDHVLRISLLRAGVHPDHLQDQGEHWFTYSLLPHGGDFVEGNVVQEAYALNNPMKVLSGSLPEELPSLVSFDQESVELDAVKRSEDGRYVVIRFHEYTGARVRVRVTPGFAYEAWAESDLRERPLTEWTLDTEICMELHPYEIRTILVKIK